MKIPEVTSRVRKNLGPALKTYNKLFCIGANKTGTTTLSYILGEYGLCLPRQEDQEVRLTKQVFSTNYDDFRAFVLRYDAFQDLPFSQGYTYIVADVAFPNSKFILTERDPDEWFTSIQKATLKKMGICSSDESITLELLKEKFRYLYPDYIQEFWERELLQEDNYGGLCPDWSLISDSSYMKKRYMARNNQIKEYFYKAKERLLVINLSEEQTTEKICEFLNIPSIYSFDMPHHNKTNELERGRSYY